MKHNYVFCIIIFFLIITNNNSHGDIISVIEATAKKYNDSSKQIAPDVISVKDKEVLYSAEIDRSTVKQEMQKIYFSLTNTGQLFFLEYLKEFDFKLDTIFVNRLLHDVQNKELYFKEETLYWLMEITKECKCYDDILLDFAGKTKKSVAHKIYIHLIRKIVLPEDIFVKLFKDEGVFNEIERNQFLKVIRNPKYGKYLRKYDYLFKDTPCYFNYLLARAHTGDITVSEQLRKQLMISPPEKTLEIFQALSVIHLELPIEFVRAGLIKSDDLICLDIISEKFILKNELWENMILNIIELKEWNLAKLELMKIYVANFPNSKKSFLKKELEKIKKEANKEDDYLLETINKVKKEIEAINDR